MHRRIGEYAMVRVENETFGSGFEYDILIQKGEKYVSIPCFTKEDANSWLYLISEDICEREFNNRPKLPTDDSPSSALL